MRNIFFCALTVLILCVYLKSEMTINRPYSTLEELDGSPSNRYPLIKVPNGTLQDNTTFFTLLLSSAVPTTLPNDSTNYIQNRLTLQSGSTFFVSSGTVDRISLFQSTISGDTGMFRIVHASTITGNSPLVLDQVLSVRFYDGSILNSSPTYSGLATLTDVSNSTSDKATISFVNIATGNKSIALDVSNSTNSIQNQVYNIVSTNIVNGTIVDDDITNVGTLSFASMTIFGSVLSTTGFVGVGSTLTSLNASNISLGTVPDGRLSTNVSLLGQTIESGEIANGTIVAEDVASSVFITSGSATVNSSHLNTTTTAGEVGSATIVPQVRFGADGRLLSVTSVTISAGGGSSDNLGSHVATQTLDMNRFIVNNIASATVYGTVTSTTGFIANGIFISSFIGIGTSNPLISGNIIQVGGGTFTVHQEGKVSIGTSNPSALLRIWDPIATSTPPILFEISTGTSKVFEVTNSSLTSNAPTGHYFTGGDFQVGALTNQPYAIVFDKNDGLSSGFHPQIGIDRAGDGLWRFGYNADESAVTEPVLRSPALVSLIEYTGAMNIALFSSGNVSIGTNTNTSRLDVYNGSVTIRGTNSRLGVLEGETNLSTMTTTGIVLINSTSPYGRLGQLLEVNSEGIEGGIAINNFQATSNAGIIDFNKSRGTTVSSHAIVSNNDALGNLIFRGSDGVGYIEAAYIAANVDGTPGVNDMPTRMVFTTTNDGASSVSERMRITSNGSIGMGATAPRSRVHVSSGAGGYGNVLIVSTGTSIIFEVNGSSIVSNVDAFKAGGGPWSSISDIRKKHNIKTLENSLEKLLRLRGVSYEWNNPKDYGDLTGEQRGFIAQELEQVFPELVGTFPDGTKYITLRGFESLFVEALREISIKINDLENRIKLLENKKEN